MKYRILKNKKIPTIKVVHLNLGLDGMMLGWLKYHKDTMTACLAYDNKDVVGWSCVIDNGNNELSIGTFVDRKYRGQKIGEILVQKILAYIAKKMPNAEIRYGTSYECRKFGDTYANLIAKANLVPNRYY